MNGLQQNTTSPKFQPPQMAANPFASHVTEQEPPHGQDPNTSKGLDPFTEALARTRGAGLDPQMADPEAVASQQEELKRKKKLEILRRELHNKINPTETRSMFDAQELKVKREIDSLRAELKMLSKDVEKFNKEVTLTLMTEVSHPGREGSYFKNFFAQLRSFIMLLRQKIKSASTWASQYKKRKKKKGPGAELKSSNKHEQTKAVWDMAHNERSNSQGAG